MEANSRAPITPVAPALVMRSQSYRGFRQRGGQPFRRVQRRLSVALAQIWCQINMLQGGYGIDRAVAFADDEGAPFRSHEKRLKDGLRVTTFAVSLGASAPYPSDRTPSCLSLPMPS